MWNCQNSRKIFNKFVSLNIKRLNIKMDPTLFFYLSSSESDGDEKIVRRQLRDRSNPLALPNTAFLKRFRLTKEAFEYVLNNICLTQSDVRAVPPVLQLATTLLHLASGRYQHSISSDYLNGICQSTVSKLTSHVLKEMETKLCPQFIRFIPEDSLMCKECFVQQYKIPGVIGCVDGTHIGLQKPTVNEHMYFNRNGYHSINAMIICEHTYKILAINCQYGYRHWGSEPPHRNRPNNKGSNNVLFNKLKVKMSMYLPL